MPKLDFLEFSGVNQAKWMHPLLNEVRLEVNKLAEVLNAQLTKSKLRKELKMDEDPWENYLAHDAKYFLPILNHVGGKSIVEQILLFKFVQHAVRNETISQYNVKDLGSAFLAFSEEYREFDNDMNLQEVLKDLIEIEGDSAVLTESVDRVAKMFFLQMKIEGKVKQFKETYFI
jgi:hypothetical protein